MEETSKMEHQEILENKRILLVDDEPDILETLEELMYMCEVQTAGSFKDAVNLLKNNTYDAAVLDIMGVQGYDLLKITHKLNIPSIMLTAHALTPDNLKASIDQGADAYVPKDKLVDITLFVSDVLLARQQGKTSNVKWFSILNPLFDKLFGDRWRQSDQEFWDEFDRNQMD